MSDEISVQDNEKWVPESALLKVWLEAADNWGLSAELEKSGVSRRYVPAISRALWAVGFIYQHKLEPAANCLNSMLKALEALDTANGLLEDNDVLCERLSNVFTAANLSKLLGIAVEGGE